MELIVIGGGPAGLRAAEVAARDGCHVRLFESQPSVGRKFLVAGKGGLNLTHSASIEKFSKSYSGSININIWTSLLSDFDNTAMRSWAQELGIETFIGTSGRIFPKEFKAAPLLRRWVERLRNLGVRFETRQKLKAINKIDDRFMLEFQTEDSSITTINTDSVILALGGASWPNTGSTAEWVPLLEKLDIGVTPLTPANCGWEVKWHSDIIKKAEGLPLKNITVTAGDQTISGELLITHYGLEGGALYQLGSRLRELASPMLTVDLKPSFSAIELVNKLGNSSDNLIYLAIEKWRLNKASASLLRHLSDEKTLADPLALAQRAKSLSLTLTGPRPIAEAISTAGGIASSELDEYLMVKRLSGLFVAGEMIDWEAPTGGYLLQGCFATGTRAALGAIRYLAGKGPTLP